MSKINMATSNGTFQAQLLMASMKFLQHFDYILNIFRKISSKLGRFQQDNLSAKLSLHFITLDQKYQ